MNTDIAAVATPNAYLTEVAEKARQHLRLGACPVDHLNDMGYDPGDDTGPEVTQDAVLAALTRAINTGLALTAAELDADAPQEAQALTEDGESTRWLSGNLDAEEFAAVIAFAAVEAALFEQAAAKAVRRAAVLSAIYQEGTGCPA